MYDLDKPPKNKLAKVKKLVQKQKKTKVWSNSDVEPTYLKNK